MKELSLGKFDMDFQPIVCDDEGNEVAVFLSGDGYPSPAQALYHANNFTKIPELVAALKGFIVDSDNQAAIDNANQLINQIQLS